jgi:pyruvate-ferredoxin/flavodoxin oxidoreductase
VRRNNDAVDRTLENLHQVATPKRVTTDRRRPPPVAPEAPDFVRRVTGVLIEGKGDLLPVSAFPPDGTWPSGTTQWEKRAIALEIPVWDSALCIQCDKCAFVCPHAAIRAKAYDDGALAGAPGSFPSTAWRGKEPAAAKFTIQVAPDDCTGCGLCVAVCPAKDKANPRHKAIDMSPVAEHRDRERENFAFFRDLPERDRTTVPMDVKGTQLLQPLFEFSGACAGCGETPYLKLLSQICGDRLLVANATGCSSIYGGNLPTTPWRTNPEGRGPAWSNSLFEDNAEYGLGMRLAIDAAEDRAKILLRALGSQVGDDLVAAILGADQEAEAGIVAQRDRIALLRKKLAALGGGTGHGDPRAKTLDLLADALVRKSVWIVGGDGWAYDIGFGGLDHVLASPYDVNVLVLDTEVYSNTGGQASKSTPVGAVAKFATGGKEVGKKDLGLLAMTYGHVYVARVAFGAKDAQTVKAFVEAEAYRGPSLILAHSPCIAHGYDLAKGPEQQRLAVESGIWPLYRYDPRRREAGEPSMQLDSGAPKRSAADFMRNEGRFRTVEVRDPTKYARFVATTDEAVKRRWSELEAIAAHRPPARTGGST